MIWKDLKELAQLAEIDAASEEKPVLIFKHSTRCSISSAALARLERAWDDSQNRECYFLDLLSHRDISNAVAERYQTQHQSPQVLIIRNGRCVYSSSHFDIQAKDVGHHMDA